MVFRLQKNVVVRFQVLFININMLVNEVYVYHLGEVYMYLRQEIRPFLATAVDAFLSYV